MSRNPFGIQLSDTISRNDDEGHGFEEFGGFEFVLHLGKHVGRIADGFRNLLEGLVVNGFMFQMI